MAPVVSVLLLAGCGGPNDETLVDELRIMAVVAEPPEVAPGAVATLTVHVADPLDEAPEAMLWTCADLGDGCLEAAEPAQGTTVGAPADGTFTSERVAPPAFAGIVADGTTVLPVPTYALACVPGACPAIALAASAPATGTDDADALSAFLGDPFDALEELPLAGTSLAFTLLSVSTRAEPVTNPVLAPASTEPVVVATEEAIDLAFAVEGGAGDLTAYGYTTAGGFDMTEYSVKDGEVVLTWIAGAEAGDATLWVVVNGEDGGSAVWTTVATIE
jgi:hypothetical protein